MALQPVSTAVVPAAPNANPNTEAPAFWKPDETALDRLNPGFGLPADGKVSKFYYYPDAPFSDAIDTQTREYLRACQGDCAKVREMLESGVDKHTANAFGFTGLHFAASKFRLDVAEILIDAGVDVNIQDVNGSTPLDYCYNNGAKGEAGSKEYAAMCEYLESKGAVRSTERAWITAHNQVKYAPNAAAQA